MSATSLRPHPARTVTRVAHDQLATPGFHGLTPVISLAVPCCRLLTASWPGYILDCSARQRLLAWASEIGPWPGRWSSSAATAAPVAARSASTSLRPDLRAVDAPHPEQVCLGLHASSSVGVVVSPSSAAARHAPIRDVQLEPIIQICPPRSNCHREGACRPWPWRTCLAVDAQAQSLTSFRILGPQNLRSPPGPQPNQFAIVSCTPLSYWPSCHRASPRYRAPARSPSARDVARRRRWHPSRSPAPASSEALALHQTRLRRSVARTHIKHRAMWTHGAQARAGP